MATALEEGLHFETAREMCKISKGAWHEWRQRGQNGEQPYANFVTAVEEAESALEKRLVKAWIEASEDKIITVDDREEMARKGDWKAIESFLKRRKPARYGENQHRIEIEQPNNALSDAEKITYLSNQIIQKMTTGEMTVDVGSIALKALEDRRKLIETCDHEQRIKATEEELKLKRSR
jgi:hypothetical protein